MSSNNTHLVVPTNRPERIKNFLDHWVGLGNCWKAIHVVFDMEAVPPEFVTPKEVYGTPIFCYSWADTSSSNLFSRGDSGIRAYGFYRAHRAGADYIVTVDDDCTLPSGVPFTFMSGHLNNLNGTPKWVSTVPGEHVRGLPFGDKGNLPCDVSMGLWTDVPDLSSPVQLTRAMEGRSLEIKLPVGTRVMPSRQYAPMCGMNLAFTRRAVPMMFFAPMGMYQPYARFDDIWCGLVAQRLMAHLGWNWTVGEPYVRHSRASDPVRNLVKEAPGIAANENYWKVIERMELTSKDPLTAIYEAGRFLAESELSDDYLQRWGRLLLVWRDLFV